MHSLPRSPNSGPAALVAGATGNVGGAVVDALVARGVPVRAVVRAATRPLPAGAQPVVADLDEPRSLVDGLDGVGSAFLLPGFADMPALVQTLRDAGARRLVLLSGSSAEDADPGNAVSEYMRASEAAVRDGGIPWTILRPNGFMSNALRWRSQLAAGDVVRLPFADVPIAMIDPDDIGAVTAEVPDDVARVEMAADMPQRYVDAFFRFYVDRTIDEGETFDTVQAVTGRAPRSFEQWARMHVADFAPDTQATMPSGV